MTTIAPNTTPLPEIPYRGIESFRFVDQRVFCAREEETWDLLRNILIYRGVLLYGDSGSGKSSLINAGLIPAAIKENLYAHRLRVQPRRGREIKVERISRDTAAGPPYLPSDLIDPAAIDDNAQSFEISLDEFYKQLKQLGGRSFDDPRPLLIFDQFEEFVTLFEDAWQGASAGQTKDGKVIQRDILNVLTSILEDESLPVKLLFVFREEYLAKLNIIFKAAPELLDQYVRLLPPRVEEAEQIILAPFVDDELKERFAGKSNQVRELEGLAQKIASQIQQRSENGFINLTELQIVCRRLWESQEPTSYFQKNHSDIQQVLEGYWVDKLNKNKLGDLYEPSIALLGHMVTSTNTRNIVSEPDLRSFEKDNFSDDQISKALNVLVESQLVRREPRHKIYFYEIVSEFLVPWIRDKKTARLAQIEANRLAAETKQRLKQVERERRYLSIGAIVLGSLLLLAIYLGIKANNLKKAAEATQASLEVAQAELKKEKEQSENLVRLENLLTATDPQQRLDAVNELIQLDKEGKLPRDLVKVIVAVIANEKNKEVSTVASYFFNSLKDLNEVQESDSDITKSIIKTAEEKNTYLTETQSTVALQPRVYFQLASSGQRARANKIADALRSNGFIVPAFDIVEKGIPGSNQLRYYDDEQGNKDNRERALAKIREIDGQRWSLVPIRQSSSVRPNHFEVWFAGDGGQASGPSPSPSPTSSEVTLRLTFRHADGHSMVVNYPRITLERNPYVGRPRIVMGTSVTAPPGNYILHVQVRDYADYRAEIVLKGTQVWHEVTLKPTRRPQAQ